MAKLASSPASLAIEIDHRLGDAIELSLVDERFARVRGRVGVITDDVNTFRQRLLQYRRDRDRIVGGEQNAVDAARDVIVDELDLFVDLGLGWAVGLGLDVSELFGRVLDTFRGGVEITDTDQFRHIDDGDRLADPVRRVRRRAAVKRLRRNDAGAAHFAGERIGRQIVAPIPFARGVSAAGREPDGDHRRRRRRQISQFHRHFPSLLRRHIAANLLFLLSRCGVVASWR